MSLGPRGPTLREGWGPRERGTRALGSRHTTAKRARCRASGPLHWPPPAWAVSLRFCTKELGPWAQGDWRGRHRPRARSEQDAQLRCLEARRRARSRTLTVGPFRAVFFSFKDCKPSGRWAKEIRGRGWADTGRSHLLGTGALGQLGRAPRRKRPRPVRLPDRGRGSPTSARLVSAL